MEKEKELSYFDNVKISTEKGLQLFREIYGTNKIYLDELISELGNGNSKYDDVLKHLDFLVDKEGNKKEQMSGIVSSLEDVFEQFDVFIRPK